MSLLTTSGSMLRLDIMDSRPLQAQEPANKVSKLWLEYETSFVCRWGSNQKTTHSIGVGYCCGGCNTLWEAFEGGLELSRILGCATVNGLYIVKTSLLGQCSNKRAVVDLIVEDWDRFFACHNGVYVQYIDGVPGEVLDSALKNYPHRNSILLVGLNCISAPKHKHSICLRSIGFYCADPRALLLPTDGNSEGIFLVRFFDPLFLPYIICAFQFASTRSFCSYSGLYPMLDALKHPLLDPSTPSVIGGLLGNTIQKVQKIYTATLAGRAKCSLFFLDRISALFFSSVRLINYTLILMHTCESTSPSFTSSITIASNFSSVVSVLTTSTLSTLTQPTTNFYSTINSTSDLAKNSIGEVTSSTVTHSLSLVSNGSRSAFTQSTISNASSTSVGSTTMAVANSAVSLVAGSSTSTKPIHVHNSVNEESFVPTCLVLWIIFGASQIVLLVRLQSRWLRLRFMALLVNAFGPVFALIDLIQNLRVEHHHCVLHTTLGIYGVVQIIREGWQVTLPEVHQAIQYAAMTITKSNPLSDCNVIKISKSFRRAMQCTRIFLECTNLMVLASLFFTGYLFCQDHCFVADAIYAGFALVMAICLVVFVVFTRKAQPPSLY